VLALGGTAHTTNPGSSNKGVKSLLHQPLINQNGIATYEVFETAALVRMNPLFLEPLLAVRAVTPRANTMAVRTANFPLGLPQSNCVCPGRHGPHLQ